MLLPYVVVLIIVLSLVIGFLLGVIQGHRMMAEKLVSNNPEARFSLHDATRGGCVKAAYIYRHHVASCSTLQQIAEVTSMYAGAEPYVWPLFLEATAGYSKQEVLANWPTYYDGEKMFLRHYADYAK